LAKINVYTKKEDSILKKSMGGSEFPDLDIQLTSMVHTDRYKGNSQTSKNALNSQKKEKNSASKT